MSAPEFGDLRSTLQRPPTREAWEELCELLDRLERAWPREQLESRAIAYAQDHLRRWDEGLRVVPRRWLDRIMSGEPCPQLAVARVLQLSTTGRELGIRFAYAAPDLKELSAIRRIDLSANFIGPEAIQELARAAHLSELRALNLDQCSIGDQGLDALLSSPSLGALEVLSLRHNLITNAGLDALVRAPLMDQLRALDLSNNPLSVSGLQSLAEISRPGVLEELTLADTPLGELGAEALGKAPLLGRLKRLSLAYCRADVRALRALFAASPWPYLESLALPHNHLTLSALAVLATASGAPRLASLDLSDNRLDRARTPSLAHTLQEGGLLCQLSALDLSSGQLTAEHMELLARAPLDGLRELDLSHNLIGPLGLDALLDAPWIDGLERLRLDHAQLSDEGAYQLAGVTWRRLRELAVRGNTISGDGLRVLRAHFPEGTALRTQENDEHLQLAMEVKL